MGNTANLVLVDGDGWQLRYSHWAGCRMLDALIAGPGELAESHRPGAKADRQGGPPHRRIYTATPGAAPSRTQTARERSTRSQPL